MTVGLLMVMVLAAPGSGRVWAQTEHCPPGFESELRRLLSIELKLPVVNAAAEGDSGVFIECTDQLYQVTLSAPRRAPKSRSLDVTEVAPMAVARAVTLVVAEALPELWRAPEVQQEALPVPAVEKPVVSDTVLRFEISPLIALRIGSVLTAGGGLLFDAALLPWLGLRVDAIALTGSRARTQGMVFATTVDGGVMIDARIDRPRWMFRGGLGARGGYARLEGVPKGTFQNPRTVEGFMWGPQVGVSAEVRPFNHLAIGLGVDGGLWASRIEGLVIGEQPVRIDGFFGTVWVSVGVRW